jgi:hypothetical protein
MPRRLPSAKLVLDIQPSPPNGVMP